MRKRKPQTPAEIDEAKFALWVIATSLISAGAAVWAILGWMMPR
jgi:hypothetical protein